DLPVEAAVDYAGERADLVGQLAPIFRELLVKEQLNEVYETLELPLVPVLIAVERAGIRVDGDAMAGLSQKVEQDLAQRSARIFEIAGGECKLNSPNLLADILCDKLPLPVQSRTGTARAH